MKKLSRQLFFVYGLFGLWILLILLISKWATPLQELITLLGLFFIPGFALKRIIKIGFENDRLGNVLITLALGFIFNTAVAFLGLFANMTIQTLTGTYIILGLIVFIASLILDFARSDEYELLNLKTLDTSITNFFKNPFNWIYIIVGLVGLMVLATVSQLGANFTGDPLNHLSIMRKIYDGQPISVENIAWVRNELYPVYIFSPWHIFLTIVTKITHSDIFNIWKESPLALSILAMLVWYWLWLKVLPKKEIAVLAWFLTVFYLFQQNGYLFTRLTVPDSLASLILFPLVFALALKFIFGQNLNYKLLITLSLLAVVMGVIHWTQYFYYLLVMGLFGILFAIFRYKDQDYKQILLKIVYAGLANLVIIGPILIYIQSKGNTISESIASFSTIESTFKNDRFYKFQIYFKAAYLLVPFLFLFVRKYRQLLFILAIFLVGPLVFNIPGLQEFFYKIFSHVFVKRFYASVEWPFVIWALFLGFVLVLVDRIISKAGKIFRNILDACLALLAIIIVWLQFSRESVILFYEKIFNETNRLWINERYYWIFAIIIIIVLGLYIWQKYSQKLVSFFAFSDYKDKLALVLSVFILVFFFSLPSQGHFKTFTAKAITHGKLTLPNGDITQDIINYDKFGGLETIDYIKTKVSPKAVFDSTDANYVLPMLVDVHMASQNYGSEPTKEYEKIYDPALSLSQRLELIIKGQIEYILVLYGGNYDLTKDQTPFDQNREYFIKVFDSDSAAIYRVNL